MNNKAFPPYLGYGKLNPDSIEEQEGTTSVYYEFLGQPVLEVKRYADRVEFTDFFLYLPLSTTVYPQLETGFLQHFLDASKKENPSLQYLIKKTSSLGNVYFPVEGQDISFDFPTRDKNEIRQYFYPDGYLFIVRIPVTETNIRQITAALAYPQLSKFLLEGYETEIAINRGDKGLCREHIRLVEFVLPAAFLYETVQWLTERDLILTEKVYRAVISDIYQKSQSGGNLFIGEEGDDFDSYSIFYNPVSVPASAIINL